MKLSPTELINKNTVGLDKMPLAKMIAKMQRENISAAKSVVKAAPQIASAVKAVEEAYKKGGKIIFIGAGTSGRLGVLEASELPPTFNTSPKEFEAVIAGGPGAVFKSAENAEDDAQQGARDFAKTAGKPGVLIAIAASGNTPYAQGALKAAKAKKYKTILITSNNKAGKKYADIFIHLPTGAEVISGSTRLKAGTAAKMALNMITTLAMVRLGKVYKNYMVDVKAANAKLKERALRLISDITGLPQSKAAAFAEKTAYGVKEAVVMAKLGKSRAQAKALLKKHRGYLSKIINE